MQGAREGDQQCRVRGRMTNSAGYEGGLPTVQGMKEGDQQCRVRGRVINSAGCEGG